MRQAFIHALTKAARRDPRIYLLAGDVGYSVFEEFAREFGPRFVNMGIAEQNMAGVAGGLAASGKIPFIYSIANFPTLRCLEQIRVDACYPNRNVKVVAIGGGLAYGTLGSTHHGTEDLAVLRALPNMTVIAPADPIEAGLATEAIATASGPAYLRLNKSGDPAVHDSPPAFEIGKAITIQNGSDATLFATGSIVGTALEAARELGRLGVHVRLVSMHTLKPIDRAAVVAAAQDTGAILTIEEHSIVGGLGSAVAEVLADEGSTTAFRRLALPDAFLPEVGDQAFLRSLYGLSAAHIVRAARELLTKTTVRHTERQYRIARA